MITMSHTWWECPDCHYVQVLDAPEFEKIGIPHCGCREDQEMELMEAPIPTVVHIKDDDGDIIYVGVALRPVDIQRAKFKKKIGKLWKQFMGITTKQTFQEFMESNGIVLLQSDEVIVTP